MNENGIGEATQVLSVTLEGAKFAVEMSKESIRYLWRFLAILWNMLNPVNGRAKNWALYHREEGKTNLKNLLQRSGGDVQYFKLSKKDYQRIIGLMKKNRMLWTQMPQLKATKDKGHEYIMFAACDAARFANILEQLKGEKVGKLMRENHCSKQEAADLFVKDNSPVTFAEMMSGIGADGTDKEFDAQMEELFGEDYQQAMEAVELKKNGKNVAKEEVIRDLSKNIRRKEALAGGKCISFQAELDKDHIVDQNKSHVLMQLEEHGAAAVWLPKEAIDPPLEQEFTGMRRVILPKEEVLLMESVKKEDDIYKKVSAEQFVQGYQRRENQFKEVQDLGVVIKEVKEQEIVSEPKTKGLAEPNKSYNMGEALNRITGKELDQDQYKIIADAKDPSKVIKCHSYKDQDPQTGRPYIKTEYEVYHKNQCVLKTHDGRFSGRRKSYWANEKRRMEVAGQFSGEYYNFYTPQEYERWAKRVSSQRMEEKEPKSRQKPSGSRKQPAGKGSTQKQSYQRRSGTGGKR